MKITVLQASEKFRKTIIHREDGQIEKLPYPMLRNVTSAEIRIDSFQDLEKTIRSASEYGQAILRGSLVKQLSDESRAGQTDNEKPSRLFVLDIDGIQKQQQQKNSSVCNQTPVNSSQTHTLNSILQSISLSHSSKGPTPNLLLQYSSSNSPDQLSCHVFGWLEESVPWDVVARWMKYMNLTVLKDQLRLNRISTALSWPLDVSVCNPSKLIYVAPPRILTPEGEQEPEEHIFVLKGEQDFIPISLFDNVPGEAQIKALETRTKISLIRKAKLPEIPKTTHQGNIDILYNPPKAEVTGEKCERGFVYLNLNGGDSWGYYYPENDPTILYNFKGEPCYMLKELCPEYYNSLNKEQTEINIPGVFRDGDIITIACALVDEQQYGYITYDASTKTFVDILRFNSKTMFLDHCKSEGLVGDFRKNITSFRSSTDFTSDSGIDFKYKRINWYQKSDILCKSYSNRTSDLPVNVKSLLMHLCRYDKETYEHLLDWLAAVLQLREPLRTAWIFTGVQGTGKNILYELMKTIIGYKYCMNPTLGQFDDQFITGALENKLFVMVDEADQDACRNAPDILSKLKQLITEKEITVRKMRKEAYSTKNNINFMFASNHRNPMEIEQSDRRFNVAPYQNIPLLEVMTREDVEGEDGILALHNIQALSDYLINRKIDVNKVKFALNNSAKSDLVDLSLNSFAKTINDMKDGKLDVFLHDMPTGGNTILYMQIAEETYRDIMKRILTEGLKNGEWEQVHTTDELKAMVTVMTGNAYKGKHAFPRAMRKEHFEITRHHSTIHGRTVTGAKIKWRLENMGLGVQILSELDSSFTTNEILKVARK